MTDKKKDIGKEDFIELDKDQYRRKSNYKVYFYIFLVILFCFSIGAIFLKKTDFLTEFTEFNKQGDIQNNESLNYKNIIKSQEIDNNLSEIMRVEDSINKNQTDLEKSLEELQKDIYNNKKRLQQTQNTLIELEKDLSKFIDQYKLDSDYYYSQKYIILNTLLRIKTKFKKRENFDEELNTLREKFNSNFEIQSLISSLQEANISKILTKTDLLINEFGI